MSIHKKDLIVLTILLLAPFFLPSFAIADSIGTLITAAAAVFAIVAGFFIADTMANYLRLQTLIADENAALIAIADYIKRLDRKNYATVHAAIDAYMIAQLNYGSLGHTVTTAKSFQALHDAVYDAVQHHDGNELSDHVLSSMERILADRQEIALAAKKNLTFIHWGTLILLFLIFGATIFTIRDDTVVMNLVCALMLTALYAVLLLLREVDNNHLLERKLSFENPREVFAAVGQPPFFPFFANRAQIIPDEQGRYRTASTARGKIVVKTQLKK